MTEQGNAADVGTRQDFTSGPSTRSVVDAAPMAVAIARLFLEHDGQEELASVDGSKLLWRLGAMHSNGSLTVAGELLFAGVPLGNGIDYIQNNPHVGTGASHTVRNTREPLLKQVYDVEAAVASANPRFHVLRGLVNREIRAVPHGVFRDALMWVFAHRDWSSAASVWVEHNSAHHAVHASFPPAVPTAGSMFAFPPGRVPLLVDVLTRLGVGDPDQQWARATRDRMLTAGLSPPSVAPITDDPMGTARLFIPGGKPDLLTVGFLYDVDTPNGTTGEMLLVLRYLTEKPGMPVRHAELAAGLERHGVNIGQAIAQLEQSRYGLEPVVETSRETGEVFYHLGRPTRRLFDGTAPPGVSF